MQKQLFIEHLKPHFYLRDKRKVLTTIDMIFFYCGKLYKITSGIKVHVQEWDNKKECAFELVSHKFDQKNKKYPYKKKYSESFNTPSISKRIAFISSHI